MGKMLFITQQLIEERDLWNFPEGKGWKNKWAGVKNSSERWVWLTLGKSLRKTNVLKVCILDFLLNTVLFEYR